MLVKSRCPTLLCPTTFPVIDQVLNFSIAYGKTAVGLSEDWNVSIEEAQATLQRWYEDRPEVRKWHQDVIQVAKADGATRTLMGRYRELPHINSSNRRLSGHAERAAINTPIQGTMQPK